MNREVTVDLNINLVSFLSCDCHVNEPAKATFVSGIAENCEVSCGEYTEAVTLLKSVLGKCLFTWETFPVQLPKSVLSLSANKDSCISNVFCDNNVDRCEAAARICYQDLNTLNKSQRQEIRTDAQFIVPCTTFTGNTCLENLTLASKWDSENLQELQSSRFVQSFVHINSDVCGFCRESELLYLSVFDIFFGWPRVNNGDVYRKLLEERLHFLICELSVKSNQKKKLIDFWSICEYLSKLPFDKSEETPNDVPLPYRFFTPNRASVDLRLHDPVLLELCLHVVEGLGNSVHGEWFQDFKEFFISQFKDEKKSVSEVKRLVLFEIMKQYAIRLFDAIRQCDTLHKISPGIAEPLIQEASFKLILTEAIELFMQNWLLYCQSYERNLKLNNPILFNIPKWRSKQWYSTKAEYLKAHRLDIHEYVLSKCISNGLEAYAYLIGRDLAFLKNRERLLRDQIFKSARFPDEQFIFQIPRRCLRNVYIYREDPSLPNRYQLVDTILISCDPNKSSTDTNQVPTIKRHIKRNRTQSRTTEVIPLMYRFPRSSFAMNMSRSNEGDNFQSHFVSDNAVTSNTGFPNILNSPGQRYHDPLLSSKNSTEDMAYTQSTYFMQSTLVLKASTRHFMWRWVVFFLCTYSWIIRSVQYFFVIIPFQSYVSYVALFKPTPIYYVYKVDKKTGYVYYDEAYYKHTIISFLNQMWATLSKIRKNFDRQLLPTETFRWYVLRPIHWIWIYIIRGILTTMVLIIFWPVLCILCSSTSIVIGLLSIFFIPLLSLLLHLLGLLFWNAYTPVLGSNRLLPLFEIIFYQFLIKSVIQFVVSLLCAFLICPAWFLLYILYTISKYLVYTLWDVFIFHIVFKLVTRIPCKENCSVKRSANPESALHICLLVSLPSFEEFIIIYVTFRSYYYYYYRICPCNELFYLLLLCFLFRTFARPEDILIVLSVQLEHLELNLWKSQMEHLAKKPVDVYNDFLQSLSTLPLSVLSDNNVANTLNTKTRSWLSLIEKSYNRRAQALDLTLDLGSELTKCFYELRISPRIHLLKRRVDEWWSEFQLNENDFTGLCHYLLRNAFGEQIFCCITEKNTAIPLQIRDPSLGQRFHELVLSKLSQPARSSSVHSLYGNDGHSANLESIDPSKEESCNLIELDNEDESLSLGSNSCTSGDENLSQRCTVKAVSSKHDQSNDNGSNYNNVVPCSSFPNDCHNSITETSIDLNNAAVSPIVHNNIYSGGFESGLLKPSIIDPMSLIHIELPNFPLSVFIPWTVRNLPSSLTSCSRPYLPSLNTYGCNKKISSQCSCISSTKASLENSFRKSLAKAWSYQSFGEIDSFESDPLMRHNRVVQTSTSSNAYRHRYSAARRLLSSWTVFTSDDNTIYLNDLGSVEHDNNQSLELHDNIHSLLCFEYEENRWCYCCDRSSAMSVANMSSVDKSIFAFQNAIQHIARVYHPCIITLFMHSRDRENAALDLSHPSIHKLTHQITRPKTQNKLLKKIHAHENIIMTDLTSYMNSSSHKLDEHNRCLHRNNGSNIHSISLDTMNNTSNDILPCFKQQQFLKSPISTSRLIHYPDTSTHHRWYSNVNVSFKNPLLTSINNNDHINNVMNQSLHFQPNWSKIHSSHEGVCDFAQPQRHLSRTNEMDKNSHNNCDNQITVSNNDNLVSSHNYGNARCCWSRLEFPLINNDDKDFSGGTPTPSLYGTEDAATTDDLDDTEDILSMSSSINRSELFSNLLNINTQEQDILNDNINSTSANPLRLPLAVPELLTISATTAGSGDTQSQLESEIMDGFSSYGLTNSRSSNPRQSLSFGVDPIPSIQSEQSNFSPHSSREILQTPSGESTCIPVGNSHMSFDSSPAETVIINGMFGASNSISRIVVQDQDILLPEEIDSNVDSILLRDNDEQYNTENVDEINLESVKPDDQDKVFEMDNVGDEECVDDEHCTLKTVIKLF
ncbi:Solute carrier family 13 (Sodium-dependent dicarboxylate transporter) member 2/3/5 [Schistosoma japonicum]|nr:Solute carrier family 13 (Sodium-dependent dicarboxylate transporter) member 2/3/5 [Schistosoma japonicum]KAH8866064.1 Solute carrier family 13 (Sodium-dependent dicarboxylate transporter) member 2/3/5 [Schistosoma japonicum]